jgi:hypothetical protein
VDPLRKTFDQAGDADLVDHFCQLAGARGAEPLAHTGIGLDHGLGAGIGLLAAATHYRQDAVFRTRRTAGHRTVDKFEAAFGGFGVELARDLGGCRGVVDEGRAFLDTRECAVAAERDRAQVVVVADAAHHEILTFGGGLRRGCGLAAEFLGPGFRLGGGAVVHRDLVTAFFHQMSRHREAHHAETEESDFSHV